MASMTPGQNGLTTGQNGGFGHAHSISTHDDTQGGGASRPTLNTSSNSIRDARNASARDHSDRHMSPSSREQGDRHVSPSARDAHVSPNARDHSDRHVSPNNAHDTPQSNLTPNNHHHGASGRSAAGAGRSVSESQPTAYTRKFTVVSDEGGSDAQRRSREIRNMLAQASVTPTRK